MPMDHPMHAIAEETYRIPLPFPDGTPLSVFNHHLAGVVVIILGISYLLMYAQPQQFRGLRYVWSSSLLFLGIYLIIYSDPPAWPTSYVSIADTWAMPEARQHKIYALLLLIMGIVEFSRSAGWLKRDSWKYAFPALAAFGAIYLLFHKHGGSAAEHMHGNMGHETVLIQHIIYTILGISLVITRLLYDLKKLRGPWAQYIWPFLTVLLGIGLVLYWE